MPPAVSVFPWPRLCCNSGRAAPSLCRRCLCVRAVKG
nr:MAG TPA: hypothetical protein [Caudoviricetes sp.]